jgi:hypothetical protein
MADFGRVDGAHSFLGSVCDWVRREVNQVGASAWNTDPAVRERSARLVARSVHRVEREITALDAAGVPEGYTRARLRARRVARGR